MGSEYGSWLVRSTLTAFEKEITGSCYTVTASSLVVEIIRVGHRKDVYDR
ncbi:hypothetical protein BH20ACI3_BH20ACI3_42630 [soil metagenome]